MPGPYKALTPISPCPSAPIQRPKLLSNLLEKVHPMIASSGKLVQLGSIITGENVPLYPAGPSISLVSGLPTLTTSLVLKPEK